MSVHRVANGWAVRWRDAGRNRRRTFDRKSDAVRYDAEVRRRKQLGTLADLDAPATTLNEYVRATWAPTYAPLLAPRTREVYAQTYGRHVGPRLGEHQLRSITPAVVSGWQSGLLRGGVGHPTIAKARAVLSAILQTAVEAGPIPTNPVRSVRAPRAPLAEEVRPLAPATVEAIRAVLPLRDATMVSVLAYAVALLITSMNVYLILQAVL